MTQVAKVRQSIVVSLGKLGSLSGAPAAAGALARVQGRMREAGKQLEAINPPAPIATQHEKLTAGVGDFADELDPVIAKLKQGELGALSQVPNLQGFSGDPVGTARRSSQAGYPIES